VAPAQKAIEHLLESNGLHESQIRPEVTYDPHTQQVSVHFVVDSGPRAHFTTPSITGDPKMPLQDIIGATHWRRWLIGGWRTVNQSRVNKGVEDIRSRYERRGRFEAHVQLKAMDYDADTNRSKPSLDIDAGPEVEVHAVGAKVSQGKLRSLVPVFEEHTVDESLLLEGERNLRDYFQSQGYFDAEVEFKPQRVVNDKATIDYLINPGKRHKLVLIDIQGNKYFRTDAIRERMFLMRASLLQFRRGRYSGVLLRRDEQSIASLYQSNGFRDAAVTHKMVDGYQGKPGHLAVSSPFRKARSTSFTTWMCRASPSWTKRSCSRNSARWKGSLSASTTWRSIGIASCSSTPRGVSRTPRLNGAPSPRRTRTRWT
jgi:outer membrane protein insertion porin family